MRSPVFESMFFGDLAEKKEIYLPDVEVEAFKNLLRLDYFDNINIDKRSKLSK